MMQGSSALSATCRTLFPVCSYILVSKDGHPACLNTASLKSLSTVQVRYAHSDSSQVTKSNCDYIRVIASKWRAFAPISVAAILSHLNVAVPKDGERSALRAVVSRRALGMKLLCTGEPPAAFKVLQVPLLSLMF